MDTKKCEKCGTENPSNATFCSECGESLPEVKNNLISKGMSYWKNQNKGFKILTGFLGCCIGAFIILMIIAAVFPTTNLSLANTTVNIDNQTTEYLLIGHTEPNATVKLSSKSLNLNGVEITPESNGTFEYKLEIPKNTSDVDVTVTAKSHSKSQNTASVNIKRPSVSVNLTPTVQGAPNKTYSKDGITFNYPESWTLNPNGFLTIGTGNTIPSVTYNAGIDKISISEYASEPPAIPATMDAVIQDMRKDMTGTYDKKEIMVAGEKGVEYIPTGSADPDTNGKKIDVYFAKGDTLYNIHLATTNYDVDISGFNMIVNTINVNT